MYNRVMAKEYKEQKKKTTTIVVLDILFKTLVAIAVIIFAYILIEKTDYSGGSMEFTTVRKTETEPLTPGPLKWFDTFKGIENVPSKKKKENSENSQNFLDYESQKNK